MTDFQITTQQEQAGIVTILPVGHIDTASCEQLEQVFRQLMNQGIYKFIVDCSQVDYLSSSAVDALISNLKTTQENNGNIVLVNPNPNIKRVLNLLGLDQVFTITDARETAIMELKLRPS